MDRLTEMEAFTGVVEQGGFTGAARKLGVSKSAVSKHVSALESRLGVRLLERTTRRVDLTDLGRIYYEQARNVLGAVQDADQMVAPQNLTPEGVVRVVVMDEISARVVAKRLPSFLKAYPAVSLHLEPATGYVELVSSGYDMALRCGNGGDGVLVNQPLSQVNFRLVATPEYLSSVPKLTRIDDLSDHPLLFGLDGALDQGLILRSRSGEKRQVNAVGHLVCRDTAILKSTVLSGAGVAYLPEFLIEDELAKGRLRDAMPDLPTQTATVSANFPPGSERTPKVAALLEHLMVRLS